MEKRKVKRLPVVTGELLVGIISRSDLLRALRAPLSPARRRSRRTLRIRPFSAS